MPSRLFYPYKLDVSSHHFRDDWFILYHFYTKCCESYTETVDPERVPCCVATDRSLCSFAMFYRRPDINGSWWPQNCAGMVGWCDGPG